MNSNDPFYKLEAVHDEATLVEFISSLAFDREDEIRKEMATPAHHTAAEPTDGRMVLKVHVSRVGAWR